MAKKKDVRPAGHLVDPGEAQPPAQGGILESPLPRYVGEDPVERTVPKDEFDRLLAEEMAKAEPRPPRMTAPLNIAQAISQGVADLPDGSAIEYPEAQHYKFLAEGGEDVNYLLSVRVTARNPAELEDTVNAAIRAGQGNFRHDGVEVYLHAVSGFRAVSRVPGRDAYATVLNYIFRVRPIEDGPEARR